MLSRDRIRYQILMLLADLGVSAPIRVIDKHVLEMFRSEIALYSRTDTARILCIGLTKFDEYVKAGMPVAGYKSIGNKRKRTENTQSRSRSITVKRSGRLRVRRRRVSTATASTR